MSGDYRVQRLTPDPSLLVNFVRRALAALRTLTAGTAILRAGS